MDEEQDANAEKSSETVGARLRAARGAAGLGLEEISERTKIALRYLEAIEQDQFEQLAGRTYAIGFARAYARAVDLDENEIADALRKQLDLDGRADLGEQVETFEPGDPARIPSARLAWTAAIAGVLAILVLLVVFWPAFLSPQGSLPDLLRAEEEESPAIPAAPASESPEPESQEVAFTATEQRVWVKFYDANGSQLFQKEMEAGERYILPKDADGPKLWTAHPEALDITVGGKRVPRLSDEEIVVKDVPVSAQALLAREGNSGLPTPSASGLAESTAPALSRPRPARPAREISQHPDGASSPKPEAAAPPAAPVSTDLAPASTVSD